MAKSDIDRSIKSRLLHEADPANVASLAHRRIKAPSDDLKEALRGKVTKHHRFMLRLHLQQIDAIEAAIAIDQEVDANVEPFRALIEMRSISGISALSAKVILAEIGADMSRFPAHAHLISWAGLCPRNDERADERRSNRMRTGAPWLKTILIQCAFAAARTKGSYLQAQFHRLRSRRGAATAIGAVAASILTAAYHMLKDGPATRTSVLITSTAAPRPSKPNALSPVFKISA